MPPPGAKPGLKQAPDVTAPLDPNAANRASGDELVVACAELEDQLEELKAKYEMYFLGVELREPAKWREELKKQVVRLKEAFTRNTGLRFRIQTLHARFLSYERLWQRAAREREEGTYRRDIEKAKRHARGGPVPGMPARPAGQGGRKGGGRVALADEDVDLSDFSDGEGPKGPAAPEAATPPGPGAAPLAAGVPSPSFAEGGPLFTPEPAGTPVLTPPPKPRVAQPAPPTLSRVGPALTPPPGAQRAVTPARPPTAPRPGAPAAPPAAGPRLGDAQMRELYDAYLSAKKRCNEDVSKLSYDAVARSVSKQIPEIMQQHKARSVEFKVVIKNGKARLTAVPKV